MTRDDDAELDALLRAVAAELKQSVPIRPSLAQRILAEVRRPAHERVLRWLVRPRPIPVSPLGMLAAAAVAGLVVLTRLDGAPGTAPAEGTAVEFVLFAPTAARVTIVGDFNDWDPAATPLAPSRDRAGLWTVDVPLSAGRHEYAFLVDGSRWVADPAAATVTSDEFGAPNSTLTVTGS
jgi:hypothetical protein